MDNIDSAIQLLQQQSRMPPQGPQGNNPISAAMQILQSGTPSQPPITPQIAGPQPMNQLQTRMGIRGARTGQGTNTLLPNIGSAIGNAGYDVGGAATDLSTQLGASPGLSAGIGTAANVATEAIPMAIGGGVGVASKVPEAMQATGKWLMGTALKPGTKEWLSGKADRAISTMLEEGYNASKGGVLAMRKKIGELGDQIESITSASGKEIDKQALIDRLLGTYDKYLLGGAPSESAASIGNVARAFSERPGLAGQQTVPIPLAQQIKQTMGRELGDPAYGAGLKPAAERDAQKALVRALKEDISSAEPAVASLNAKESALINAAKIAARRSGIEGNANPLSLALLTHSPEAAIGFLADKWGVTKSLAARLLYSQSKAVPASIGRAAGAIPGAISGQEP